MIKKRKNGGITSIIMSVDVKDELKRRIYKASINPSATSLESMFIIAELKDFKTIEILFKSEGNFEKEVKANLQKNRAKR